VETVPVAVAAILVGMVVGVFGARSSRVLLPCWGLLTGFVLGADLAALNAGVGLLTTAGGWLAGVGVGVLLAALAWLWFHGAVLVLGIGLGSSVLSGLIAALGVDSGLLTLLAGVAVGAAVAVLLVLTGTPSLPIAAISGYAGATWVTVGGALLAGHLTLADLHGVGPAGAMRGDVSALAIAFVLGTLAFGFQALDLGAHEMTTLRRDGYRLQTHADEGATPRSK
jgi:hypothetical protein